KKFVTFLENEGVPTYRFDFVSTGSVPLAVKLTLALQRRARFPRKISPLRRFLGRARARLVEHRQVIERSLVNARSIWVWMTIGTYLAVLAVVALPILLFVWLGLMLAQGIRVLASAAAKLRWSRSILSAISALISHPGEEALVVRLYRLMEEG